MACISPPELRQCRQDVDDDPINDEPFVARARCCNLARTSPARLYISDIDMFRIKDGKLAEHWDYGTKRAQ
jgi:predicted SnoaL-like aldol condensation-catalyzing enzyme